MRYVAFLRGVSPMALKMPELAGVLEGCGFDNVRTLLSSGNAAFDATADRPAALEKRIEAALEAQLGRTFKTFVRSQRELQNVVAQCGLTHPAGTKPIVVFLRHAPQVRPALPVEKRSSALVALAGTEGHGYYTPGKDASAFMAVLGRMFGTEFTTRTAETVRKCAAG
jgi:uncharacterized protein (DUF1697 family)